MEKKDYLEEVSWRIKDQEDEINRLHVSISKLEQEIGILETARHKLETSAFALKFHANSKTLQILGQKIENLQIALKKNEASLEDEKEELKCLKIIQSTARVYETY